METAMKWIVSALLLALGLAAGGWCIGHGFEAGRNVRVVSVKGLAERDVKADLALWQLRFVRAGDQLADAQAAIQKDDAAVTAFLAGHGLGAGSIAFRDLEVTDRAAQAYGDGKYPSRYIVTRTVMVRSADVDKVAAAYQASSALVDAGVVLGGDGPGNGGPIYLFDGINTLKPAMIAAATRNARAAAEQFARDSGSRLGGIQRANQGVFEILPRDKAPMLQQDRQINKTVRVVATLEYRLQ
jgi:hypothetical protein